jgi:hypothetical protein
MSILEALPVFARALLLLGCREQQTRQNSPYIKNLPRLVDIHAAMPFEEVVRYISQELSDSIINAAKAQHEGFPTARCVQTYGPHDIGGQRVRQPFCRDQMLKMGQEIRVRVRITIVLT